MADTFVKWNATTVPIWKLEYINFMIDHGLVKFPAYTVRQNGAYYEALSGTDGTLDFGGSGNVGGVDGTDVDAVQQAAIDAVTTGGIVLLKDLALGTVTNDEGVTILVEDGGQISYYFTQPDTEVATETNDNNVGFIYVKCNPTKDPDNIGGGGAGASAYCAIAGECIAKTGLSEYFAGGYFAAEAESGCSGDVWGANTLVRLASGSTGNALGLEIDVDNLQQNGVGTGCLIVMGDTTTFNCNYGLEIKSQSATNKQWGTGIQLGNCATAAITTYDANDVLIQYYNASGDANPMVQVTSSGISFGAGGASALDTNISRSAANTLLMVDDALAIQMANNTDTCEAFYVTADAEYRFFIRADGALYWGSGAAAQDVVLYRAGANQLKTDDDFYANNFQPITGYKATDGTSGSTGTVVSADDGTFNFKNGLWVGQT